MHLMINEGSIEVTQEGPVHYNTAEVGVNMQSVGDFPVNVKIGHWKTKTRNFAVTHDLFICRSAKFDLSEMELELTGEDSGTPMDAQQLVYQLEASKEAKETCEVKVANRPMN